MRNNILKLALTIAAALLAAHTVLADDDGGGSILQSLPRVPQLMVSTVPSNGDLNPYGVAFVPRGFRGKASPGSILVSNFNNSANQQGTGTTIVNIAPGGQQSVFFQGSAGLGLTTALGVLEAGFVIVGNVPTTDGTCATVQPGSLLILDSQGHQVMNLANTAMLDGPWDLTLSDDGDRARLFVSDVLSGAVVRFDVTTNDGKISVRNGIQIAGGYLHRCDPNALVVGPTGLAYDAERDILYVASTGDNAIYSIPHAGARQTSAGTGNVVYTDSTHLHGPLALVLAPNGHLITANGDAVNPDPNHPSELVEFTVQGRFVAERSVNSTGLGGAFGIALASSGEDLRLAAVDDILNVLDVWIVHGAGE